MKIADYFSPQAKAVVSAVLVFLAQMLAFIGTGGYAELQALTLGQWIGISIATLVAWGFTYAVPNQTEIPVAPKTVAEGKELAAEAQVQLEAAKSAPKRTVY